MSWCHKWFHIYNFQPRFTNDPTFCSTHKRHIFLWQFRQTSSNFFRHLRNMKINYKRYLFHFLRAVNNLVNVFNIVYGLYHFNKSLYVCSISYFVNFFFQKYLNSPFLPLLSFCIHSAVCGGGPMCGWPIGGGGGGGSDGDRCPSNGATMVWGTCPICPLEFLAFHHFLESSMTSRNSPLTTVSSFSLLAVRGYVTYEK